MNGKLFAPRRNPLARYKGLLPGERWYVKGRVMTAVCLRVMTLMLILVGAYSATPRTAAAAVTSIPLGCAASEFGQNIVISLSNDVPEGAAIVVAVQVIARNEDLTGIVDPAGNSYTRQVKHLGFEVGTSVKENYTLHVYTASDAKTLKKGQAITVQWSYANQLEACAVAINGVMRTPVDQRAENHAEIQAESAALDSLNAPNTTTPNQVLVGAFGWFCVDLEKRVVCDATSTPGADYTEVLEGQDVMIQTRDVTAAGAYKATATLNKTAQSSAYKATFEWNAALITLKVDSTPPVIAGTNLAGTLGQNGWYTSDVVVTWNISEPESRVLTSCDTRINTDTAGVSVPCTATSAGGSSTAQSATFKRDATPPTITAAVAPAPNASGWHKSDVTVTYTCADALAGLAAACPAPQVVSAEGNAAIPIISDLAGNKSVAGVSARIDKSAPVVAVTGVNNGATYVVGSVPAATCSTTDALSGVATQATATVTGGGAGGLGVFTVTCSGGVDRAGNGSQPVAISYTVTVPPTPTPLPPNVRTVVAWGSNRAGANSAPAGLLGIAVASGVHHSLALKSDGTVVSWGCGGSYNYGQCTIPAGLSDIKAIGAGQYHSLAVKADGKVVAWGCAGSANVGQCPVPVSVSDVISVTGGFAHSLGLKKDGTVVAWGCYWRSFNYGQCTVPAGLIDVVAIAAGADHSLALKRDGTVVVWGRNNGGQLNMPAGLSGVVAIAAGSYHNLALKSDGTVVAWGCAAQLNNGQCTVPAGLSGVVAISGGFAHSLALKNDGTIVSWGCVGTDVGQCAVPAGVSGATAISAGGLHSVALTRLTPAGGAAGGAVVAADSSAAANEALIITPLDEMLALTLSVPLSRSMMEGAPVITTSVPVSAPAVVTAPVVADTPPADAAAPSENPGSNQIFLPLIANLAGTALGGTTGLVVIVLLGLVIGGGIFLRRTRRPRK